MLPCGTPSCPAPCSVIPVHQISTVSRITSRKPDSRDPDVSNGFLDEPLFPHIVRDALFFASSARKCGRDKQVSSLRISSPDFGQFRTCASSRFVCAQKDFVWAYPN